MSVEKRAIKVNHLFVTTGSLTERGGRVTAANSVTIDDLPLAVVGDTVAYADGSRATIIDGAGFGAILCGTPFALVGSRLDNGDRIINTLQTHDFGVVEYHGESIKGLFDPTYVPPVRERTA